MPIGPPDVNKKDDEQKNAPTYQGKGPLWTVAYYLILVAGATGFYWLLIPLTESKHALPVFK
jgi:prenyl protein peptidase